MRKPGRPRRATDRRLEQTLRALAEAFETRIAPKCSKPGRLTQFEIETFISEPPLGHRLFKSRQGKFPASHHGVVGGDADKVRGTYRTIGQYDAVGFIGCAIQLAGVACTANLRQAPTCQSGQAYS